MKYTLKGNLSAWICNDCLVSIRSTSVRVYTIQEKKTETILAVANAKETFHMLSSDEMKSRKTGLLAEGKLDENGNFELDFDEKSGYKGGAFEIDWYCGTVPIPVPHPPKDFQEFQFNITTLQPIWQSGREDKEIMNYGWNYTIPAKWFCYLLQKLKLWVVCGLVKDCKNNIPIPGVKVFAYDVDLIQDDSLGSAITNSSGHFVLWFSQDDFSKTIFSWLNIEWRGPDLYFRVEQMNGVVLLQEPRSKGHTAGRENVGNCTCVTLCIEVDVPVQQPVPVPAFLRIGGIDYETQMHSHVGENGLTNGNYAFFSSLRLNGIVSAKNINGIALEYCFEYTKQYDGGGFPINWTRVLANQIDLTYIGYIEKATAMPADATHPFPWTLYNNQDCYVSNVPVPGAFTTPIAGDGWILVPQQNDNPYNALGVGLFVANGNQINLNSPKLDVFAPINLAGLVAGNSSTSTGQALASDEVFAIRMLIREQGNNATIQEAGRCTRTAIDNTLYNGMSHHPEWGPWGGGNEYGVCMVDILQLQMAGCAKITNQVDVLFTCAHPNLGVISVSLTGPNGTIALPVPPVSPDVFGTITHAFAVSDPLCAYLVTLSATYLLTTGDSNLSSVQDQIAFCR